MNSRFVATLLWLGVALVIPQIALAQRASVASDRGLVMNAAGAYPGFTLFTPLGNKATHLINMDGEVVHSWNSDHPPANSAFILKNGDLLRCSKVMGNARFGDFGPSGGRVEKFSWDGKRIWEYVYSDDQQHQHHDIRPLPNGNVLLIAWHYVSKQDAIAAGRNPKSLNEKGIWPDKIVEVKQTGAKSGQVVWEWNTWDHIIQDFDKSKANFGDVAAHPELIDVNLSPRDNPDWMHTNGVAYNPKLDQIILCARAMNEFWVIDHSTTTQQAAGHTGGRCGKGGDLLYRWGNPANYRAGSKSDQTLFSQHDARWVDEGQPGAGNIMIFNNGSKRPGGNYSSVDEITPPVKPDGTYEIQKRKAFAPQSTTWSYQAENKTDFYSSFISGAERLPNGNTLVCAGAQGEFFELTPQKKVVWKYLNPYVSPGPGKPPGGGDGPGGGGGPGPHIVFRVERYAPDYSAFEGKNLKLENAK